MPATGVPDRQTLAVGVGRLASPHIRRLSSAGWNLLSFCSIQEIPDSPDGSANRLDFWNDGVRENRLDFWNDGSG